MNFFNKYLMSPVLGTISKRGMNPNVIRQPTTNLLFNTHNFAKRNTTFGFSGKRHIPYTNIGHRSRATVRY
jgi:hypothetical protein